MEDVSYHNKEEKKDNDYGQMGMYQNYEIKNWADKIVDAESIKNDPKKMEYVKKCLAKENKAMDDAISSIDDLRERSKKVARYDNDMD